MAELPVPAEQYFKDFGFDVEEYQIFRNGTLISTAQGLSNSSYGQQFISFLFGVDVQPGDTLRSKSTQALVARVEFDTYNGERQLTNAYLH